ncbi:hypothetical protein [Flavobacterium oreochromis]|uniref:hypothetical protein n=1 Tax=Flavobacterium oreochromis TaxID=2906078 RepID=UPI00403FD145
MTVNLYSLHQEVLWNYNMLLFNPLYLVLTYFILKRQTKIISKITLICLFSTGIYLFFMLNKPHLFLIIPLVISNFILTLRAYKER